MSAVNFYTKLINDQLLNVVKQSFQYIIEKKQLHNHEIYLTFDATLCQIAPKLQAMYKHNMSILIYQNYTELIITNTHLIISLQLVTGHETLHIPFTAIIEYIDHTEKFSLKFTPDTTVPANQSVTQQTENHTTMSSKIIKLHDQL